METGYSTKDYYYDLPEELIAQDPLEDRSSSRLMVLGKKSGEVSHHHFRDILDYLRPGDCLVINNTRVIPARLIGTKKETGAHVEILLLRRKKDDIWETLVKPGKKLRPGAEVTFGDGSLTATILDVVEGGDRLVQFHYDGIFEEVLDRLGEMPLPPYITEKLKDKERYQTVYSNELGSSAAPTAGLHFTKEQMADIEAMGVNIAYVTLHVGLGTFRPVKEDRVLDHKMHREHYEIPERTAELINKTKAAGGRVIAVGTTSCRTLESVATFYKEIKPCEGYTDIFIYPGYEFKVLDGLITNFHLPESTLIMLVSAFLGYENTMNAYKVAVEEKYRFFSFGDSMFIS